MGDEKLLGQLKEAIVAIRKLKAELQKEKLKKSEPIAVIGMGMRFPGGVKNADDYWNLLENGIDAISDVPKERYDAEALYDEDPNSPGKITVKQGGFVDGVDQFDVSFFDISPIELENVDPQQRFLLEVTHEAFENAGIDVLNLQGSNTGVYIGVANNDYQTKHFRSGDYKLINPYSFTGSTISANAGRISYLMGLQGPCVTMDTACSSSLVSTHLASKALRSGECDIAVAGGVNLVIEPEVTIYFSTLNALSPEGRCKTFDNDANGFARSEGCGVFVLKRLSDAQRDGDNILAVIKGTATNQDGRSNGFTAPNVVAQEQLIRLALKDANLRPEDVGFIEAHGTGTKIGDPIEVEAIAKVFKNAKTKENPLILGSVKSNIGHLEAAAGMAGMIKAVLCVQNNQIPKNLHFNTPNELIHWDSLPLKVATSLTPLKGAIGISGFGVTGTNGHVIIDKTPVVETEEAFIKNANDLFVLPVSAKSSEALLANAKVYADFISGSNAPLEDICAAAALNRSHFEFRQSFTAKDKATLVELLNDFAESQQEVEPVFEKEDHVQVAFVFPGQGSQWVEMGKALMQREPVFKEALEACNTAFKKFVDWDLFEELDKSLSDIDIIQPVLVAIEVALAKWWQSKGIQPDVVIGHSMGEVAAAYIAGHLSLEDAANVICSRSRLMKSRSGFGVMGVTELSFDDAQERIKGLEDKLSVAVTNSPTSTVLSGDETAMKTIFDQIDAEGKFCRLVKVDVASHSVQMDPILEDLRNAVSNINPVKGSAKFYSTALNKEISGDELSADYWVKNLRTPVRFGDVIQSVVSSDKTVFIEMSPHPLLFNAIQDNINFAGKDIDARVIASFYREKDECLDLHANLGELYASGFELDWTKLYHKPAQFVTLPNYQWQRERFWFDEQPEISGSKKSNSASQIVTNHFYQYEWETVSIDSENEESPRILIVQDEDGISELIGTQLSNAQINFEITSSDNIEAALSGNQFHKIVFVGGKGNTEPNLDSDLELGSMALQRVVNSLQKINAPIPQLTVVTNSAFAKGNDEINTASSLLTGVARTLRNEHPELKCVSADISDSLLSEDIDSLTSILQNGKSNVQEYAIRNGVIQTQKLNQKELHLPTGNIAFDQESCFLITGGTSGLGMAFAEWLAKNGVGKIALVSRSGEKPGTKEAIERMSLSGCNTQIFSADISSLESVKGLVSKIDGSLGKISGVVHAAGLLDDGTFVNLTKEQFENVANPKVVGAWNLHEALVSNELSHFISFSSGAAVLGSTAQSNYNAANFYLDQLMLWRASKGLAATTINWGNIGGVGLAAAQENRGDRLAEIGMNAIQPNEFDAFFTTIVASGEHQLIPVKIDFEKWATAHPSVKKDITFENVLQSNDDSESSFDSPTSPWGESMAVASRKLRDMLKKHMNSITKIPTARIKEDDTFKGMGVDSMMALQLKNKIQADTDLNIAVSTIWTHSTIKKYVDFLTKELNLETQFENATAIGSVHATDNILTPKNIKDKLKQHISGITKIPTTRMKETDTFKSMGIDSMQALQLKNKLQADFGLNLAVASIWTHPTIEKYTAFLMTELGLGQKATEEEVVIVESTKSSEEINEEVGELSLDELMKQLDDKSKEH